MDETIISNWNKVVAEDDVIWHFGDFALTSRGRAKWILDRLNGYKILIKGNHDKGKEHMLKLGFDEVYDTMFVKDNFLLSHVAVYIDGVPCMNVGVDVWNFTPIPFPTTTQQMNLHGHVHENFMFFCNIKDNHI